MHESRKIVTEKNSINYSQWPNFLWIIYSKLAKGTTKGKQINLSFVILWVKEEKKKILAKCDVKSHNYC